MPASHRDELIISVATNHRQVFRSSQDIYVGREGNVRIGADDVNLHRIMFVVWHNGSTWMIRNRSSYLPLTITPKLQRSQAVITMGPGSVASLPPGESRVTFSTQTRSYMVMVFIPTYGSGPSRLRAVAGGFGRVGGVRVRDTRRCCVRVVYYPAVAMGTVRKPAGVTRDIMRRLR